MMVTQPEILVVGNYCHDTLIGAQGNFEILGGSASYISAALKGLNARFRLVAKVGEDFRYFKETSPAPIVSSTHPTTHFIDDTISGERRSLLKARCEEIYPKDIGNECFKITLASGVAGEITPSLLTYLRSVSEILICDAQGLIRSTDQDARVIHRPIFESDFKAVLGEPDFPVIDFLKMSESEALCFTLEELHPKTTVLLTLGKNGCDVIRHGQKKLHVPAFSANEVDPTGAGDCFLAGFAHALLMGGAIADAVREGNRLGAIAVGQIGVPSQW
jgi:1D-myo-inositol 3-kinase